MAVTELRLTEALLRRKDIRGGAKLLLGIMRARGPDARITRAEVAKLLGVTSQGAAAALDNLMRAGLIVREYEDRPAEKRWQGGRSWFYVYRLADRTRRTKKAVQ